MREFFRNLARNLETGRPAELVSVASAEGSTPRGAGAMMAVFPGGKISGTIGGGNVEYACQKLAAELLEQGAESEYTFLVLRYDPQTPETVRNFVCRMHPVGVIYFEEEIDSGILQYLQGCGLRTVMCGGVALDHQSDRVHVNDIAAAYEGTSYLLDLGHREILFLSDDEQKIGAGFQRITGSRRAMEERMLDGFSPEERERFADYLGRAYRNLKSERGEGT